MPLGYGCPQKGAPDRHDWIRQCEAQTLFYWVLHEQEVLLKILN